MEINNAAAPVAKKHLLFLDVVRGVAAFYVVLHHAALNLPRSAGESGALRALHTLFSAGHYSVDVFIVLSGFCLMLPVLGGKPFRFSEFIVRRAWRILPPYYFALLFSLLMIWLFVGDKTGTHWDACIPVTQLGLITHILLISEWWGGINSQINHAFWSIGVEWKIYFLFPLLLLSWRRFGATWTLLASVVGTYLLWMLLVRNDWLNPTPWGSSVYYVGLFAMGMFAAYCAQPVVCQATRAGRAMQRLRWPALAVSSLLVLAVTLAKVRFDLSLQVCSLFVGIWTALLLWVLALRPGGGHDDNLLAKLFAKLGVIGYSVYLVHAPLLQIVWQYVIRPFNLSGVTGFAVMLSLSLLLTLVVAQAFYKLFEQPFHKKSRKATSSPVAGPVGGAATTTSPAEAVRTD